MSQKGTTPAEKESYSPKNLNSNQYPKAESRAESMKLFYTHITSALPPGQHLFWISWSAFEKMCYSPCTIYTCLSQDSTTLAEEGSYSRKNLNSPSSRPNAESPKVMNLRKLTLAQDYIGWDSQCPSIMMKALTQEGNPKTSRSLSNKDRLPNLCKCRRKTGEMS